MEAWSKQLGRGGGGSGRCTCTARRHLSDISPVPQQEQQRQQVAHGIMHAQPTTTTTTTTTQEQDEDNRVLYMRAKLEQCESSPSERWTAPSASASVSVQSIVTFASEVESIACGVCGESNALIQFTHATTPAQCPRLRRPLAPECAPAKAVRERLPQDGAGQRFLCKFADFSKVGSTI